MDLDLDERLPNPHPGEVLELEFLGPLGLSQSALARAIRVPRSRIAEIVGRSRPVTPDTALRLGRFFKTTAKLWLGLQADYDLEEARRELSAELEAIDPRDGDSKQFNKDERSGPRIDR